MPNDGSTGFALTAVVPWPDDLSAWETVGLGVLLALGVFVSYQVVNGVITYLERRRSDFPISKTGAKHRMAAHQYLVQAAELCISVYSTDFDGTAKGYKGHECLDNDRGKKFCHVLWKDDLILVVFRGTREWKDWITNLRFLKTRVGFADADDQITTCKIHRGFASALEARDAGSDQSAMDRLRVVLGDLLSERPERTIYLSGHSLGGALAVLAAARLHATWPQAIGGVLTFGQPAISDRTFRRWYPLHDRTHRYCAGIDIVTFLPPLISYRHVGHQYWFHKGLLKINNIWAERLFKGFTLGRLSFKDDHGMKIYKKEIERRQPARGRAATAPDVRELITDAR